MQPKSRIMGSNGLAADSNGKRQGHLGFPLFSRSLIWDLASESKVDIGVVRMLSIRPQCQFSVQIESPSSFKAFILPLSILPATCAFGTVG